MPYIERLGQDFHQDSLLQLRLCAFCVLGVALSAAGRWVEGNAMGGLNDLVWPPGTVAVGAERQRSPRGAKMIGRWGEWAVDGR